MALSNLVALRGHLTIQRTELARAEESEAQRERVQNAYNVALAEYETIKEYRNNVVELRKICKKFSEEYKLSRRDEIESRVVNILDQLLPDENFDVAFDIKMKYNKFYADLKIGPRDVDMSEWSDPKTANGDFIKQVISASIVHSICDMLGKEVLLLDEQFCSSDPINAAKISAVLFTDNFRKTKQVIMIEHKPEVYNDLDIHMVRPHKSRSGNDGYVDTVTYKDGLGSVLANEIAHEDGEY